MRLANVEEVISAWRVLECVGRPELKFTLYREDERKMNLITGLIKSMPNFNERDNQVVARELEKLINKLPRTYYNENNPNNGMYAFDGIVIKGDDTITLRSCGFVKANDTEYINNIKDLVNTIGRNMKADEHSVSVNKYGHNMQEIIIRLWWD